MTQRRRRERQKGQETLQAILVGAFILLPLVAAIFSLGGLIHTYVAAQAAASLGARDAGIAGGFGSTQYQSVVQELQANGLSMGTCNVSASSSTVSLNQPISVSVTCPRHVGIPFLFQTDVNVSSTFVARGEVNQ